MQDSTGLVRFTGRSAAVDQAIANAARLWAEATTNLDSRRSAESLRIKTSAVRAFFAFTPLGPSDVPVASNTEDAADCCTLCAKLARLVHDMREKSCMLLRENSM